MQTKTTAKDFFLYLGVIIGIYVNAISFLTLVFQILERNFPLVGQYIDYTGGSMRNVIAILIIFFPAFIYLSYLVNKDLKTNPEKKELWIRRWMIFLTLFLAGLTVAIDLVTLIQRFLSAEDMTLRFILKVVFVLLVAIAVFRYYLYDLRRNIEEYKKGAKIFVYAISIITLAAVVYGITIIGSPAQQRARNFDQMRVNDLMSIQSQIVYTQWQNKGTVPTSLDALKDPISGYAVPVDPETSAPYEYKKLSSNSFELCATFDTSDSQNQQVTNTKVARPMAPYPVNSVNENWQHDTDRVCFDRTIDPTLYKVQPVK